MVDRDREPTRRDFVRNVSQAIHPWTPGYLTTWSISTLKTALVQHRQGQFNDTAMLLDSLWEDDEFPGDVEKRINCTLHAKRSLKVAGDRRLKPMERAVQDNFDKLCPSTELYPFQADVLMLGVGVGTIDWQTGSDIWIPRFRHLPAHFLQYDEERRKWMYQAREGWIEVTPGDGTWVLSTSGQRGWIRGLIRAISLVWIGKQLTLADWERYNEKHGLPIFKAKTPLQVDNEQRDQFLADLEDLRSEGVIGLPQDENGHGYDLDLLEATDRNWESFKAKVERADRKMAMLLLGGNLGNEVASTGANRAAAETHADSLYDKAAGDELQLHQVIQEQILRPFFALNEGRTDTIPYPCWDVYGDPDPDHLFSVQGKLLDVVSKAKDLGYQVDNLQQTAEGLGLKLSKPEDPAILE